ncbi:MAG: DNA polymerase III subunit beta, partial [Patescibacteria group bacterium]|nr:DNA polymerase III subunit beta [Patescibacteria group bacterium]
GNILLEAKDDRLTLTTTNLEVTIKTSCEASVEKDGAITIPAKLFSGYISLVSGDKIEGELQENMSLKLIAGGSQTEIKGISADEFPIIPEVDAKTTLNLPAPVLTKALDQTVFSASSDPTRPVLNAILLWVKKDTLYLVATNSYRLAEKQVPLLEAQKNEVKVLIPARAANELAALLSKEAEIVVVKIGDNQIKFEIAHTEFTTRLVDGKFPDYEQIIPKETKISAFVLTEDLIMAVRRAGLFADQMSGKIRLHADKDRLVISTDTGQIGKDEIVLPAKVTGGTLEIALNVAYLVDMLGRAGTAEVEIKLVDALKPAVLIPAKDKKYTYVVMPLKLD